MLVPQFGSWFHKKGAGSSPSEISNQVKAMHKFCDYKFLIDPITDKALEIGIMSLIKTKTS